MEIDTVVTCNDPSRDTTLHARAICDFVLDDSKISILCRSLANNCATMGTRALAKKSRDDADLSVLPVSKPSAQPFRFGFLVHDVSRMRRTLFDVRMKPLGITRSQWSVLAALSRRGDGGVMQIELARQMDVGKVTIGGLIQRLENIGYVRREDDENDRRARRVFITERGYDIIHQMETLGAANNASTLLDIDPAALKITEDTLAKVKANIRRELEAAGSGLARPNKR